jgi:dihydroorotase/allantoinase
MLWDGIKNGGVDTIGSDHSPHTPEEKMVDNRFEDIWGAMAGFVGVETSVPLMLTKVNEGKLTLERYVELASVNMAKLIGLYPQKGSLEVGADADITIVDLNKEGTIESSKLHSKTKVSPFDGWKVKGQATHTIVNGKIIYEDGKIVGKPGDGKFVPSKST